MEPGRPIDINTRLTKNRAIVSNKMDNETVMMSIENGEYYGINPIGSRIWELLDRPAAIADLCESLMEEYDVSAEDCRRDVAEFIGKLLDKDLITLD